MACQIGYMPPAEDVTADNVMNLVAYGQTKGFDFVVAPITSPAYKRVLFAEAGPQDPELIMWRAGQSAFRPSDLVLSVADHSEFIVGTPSSWHDFDSSDPKVRLHSELAIKQEVNWVSHIGLGGIMLPYPRSGSLANYSRVIAGTLAALAFTTCWFRVPVMDHELEDARKAAIGHEMEEDDLEGMQSWERWNQLRTMTSADALIGLVLELTESVPSDKVLDRWFAEPVKAVIIPESIFLTNLKGFPVLSKRHQQIVRSFIKHKTSFVISSDSLPTLVIDEFTDDVIAHSLSSPHADYIRYLHRTQEAPGVIDRFAVGYQDYLQAPLQPLQDNLESSTYETFEKDPIKYQQYELAVERALLDRPVPDPESGVEDVTVLMVVGAGRGPLVNCSLRAAERANRRVRIYAVEKNPNAFVTLQNMKAQLWGDRVTIVFSDMRTWRAPEQADILVSELLGSFGDNELSPECLDGAQKFLKPEGISIPADYTTFVAPMSSSKLHNNVASMKEASHYESSYVVMLKAISLLAQPKPIWRFDHPNRIDIPDGQDPLSNHHNIRSTTIRFKSETSGIMHGIAGYFESVLYKDVMISINPATHSPGMFSWFPIFFPIKTPIYIPAQADVILDFWRLTSATKVWYEWRVSCELPEGGGLIHSTKIHNIGGKSSFIGLQ